MTNLMIFSEKSKRRTKTFTNSIDPSWNQTFYYSVKERDLQGRALELTVWDYDRVGASEFLGEVSFTWPFQSSLIYWIDDYCKALYSGVLIFKYFAENENSTKIRTREIKNWQKQCSKSHYYRFSILSTVCLVVKEGCDMEIHTPTYKCNNLVLVTNFSPSHESEISH